jgi:hypothetical protein
MKRTKIRRVAVAALIAISVLLLRPRRAGDGIESTSKKF